jgi:LemA protein
MKKFALGFGGIVGLLLLLAIVLLIGGCNSYNKLVSLSQGTDRGWADVQNVYQRRLDLIPNLVSTVQGAANFEKSTITEVTQARASVGQVKLDASNAPRDAEQLKQFEQAQGTLSSALSRLLVVAERYPELRATQAFRDLQAQLEGTENRIAVERRNFNEAVQKYNTAVKSFPNVLYAGAMGFQPKPFFQATAGAETAPKVQFDFGKPAANK